MKVLVTGGAGFIGSHIVEHFSARSDVDTIVLDNLSTGNPDNLRGFNCEMIEGSIEDDAVLAECCCGVDYIFHMAAMVSVVESMDSPDKCVDTNVKGTLKVLKAAAQSGVKRIMFS
jgi:UDP-glucose 4-epimerase